MTEPTKKLTWKGSPRCRTLMVHAPNGAPIFYGAGERIPDGVLTQQKEDELVERGLLDRVLSSVVRTPVAPIAKVVPKLQPIARPANPQTIKVPVGVMEAEVKAGPDEVLGTADDLINIRRKGKHSIASDEEVKTEEKVDTDATPKTAPTRKRKASKKKGKTTKKASKK